MSTSDEIKSKRYRYVCIECKAATWFLPVEMHRATKPRCSGCGSFAIEYERSFGSDITTAKPTPVSKRRKRDFQTLPPEVQQAYREKYIRKAHEEFKLRRKHGILLHRPGQKL